jgi:hypothetical protein
MITRLTKETKKRYGLDGKMYFWKTSRDAWEKSGYGSHEGYRSAGIHEELKAAREEAKAAREEEARRSVSNMSSEELMRYTNTHILNKDNQVGSVNTEKSESFFALDKSSATPVADLVLRTIFLLFLLSLPVMCIVGN